MAEDNPYRDRFPGDQERGCHNCSHFKRRTGTLAAGQSRTYCDRVKNLGARDPETGRIEHNGNFDDATSPDSDMPFRYCGNNYEGWEG